MFKKMIFLTLLAIFIPLVASAQVRNSTDRLAADALICTGRCVLYGLLIETDGTNNVTAVIYDNTAASGKILRKMIVPGANFYGGFELPVGLNSTTGIYVDITGTGAAYWITWGNQ